VYESIAQAPLKDTHGHTWQDDATGQDMTLSDHVEALTGQRLRHRDGLFETGDPARSTAAAHRLTRFGHYDDPDDSGQEMTACSERYLAAMRGAMGLPDQAAERQDGRDRAFDRLVQRPPQRYRTISEAMDHGESTRERAARYRQPLGTGVVTTA
jgi:hypothetical protein